MKQSATIRTRKQSKSQKAILLNHRGLIEDAEQFVITFTAFVPKADLRFPMPKAALSITVGDDVVRFVSSSTDNIEDILRDTLEWWMNAKSDITAKVIEEQKSWLEKQSDYHLKVTNKMRVIEIKKEGGNGF